MTDWIDDAAVPAWFAALRGRWRLRRVVLAWRAPDSGPRERPISASGPDAVVPGVLSSPSIEARLTGEVTLSTAQSDLALHYVESGVLRLRHGHPLQSTRRYLYRCETGGDGHTLEIDFADGPSSGQPFVRLPWPALQERDAADGEDLHVCGADRYHVRYRFEKKRRDTTSDESGGMSMSRPDGVAIAWSRLKMRKEDTEISESDEVLPLWNRIVQRTRVRGPKKDYAIVSILDRIDTSG
ncbi:DUF6314 family protein [Robbsia andropogonis]|uniref:DUF6314 family protein n=1 Tax=Robbsia andropogonis TaxID=28092 RepID=UPI0004637D87|nr:DUF6314 family protein [Robbsia andropogonis]